MLDFAESLVEHRAEHLTHEWTSHQTVPMLARQRAPEFQDQRCNLPSNGFECPYALAGFQINDRSDVQASHRSMRINSRRCMVASDDFEEALDELTEVFGRDGGVLYKGD